MVQSLQAMRNPIESRPLGQGNFLNQLWSHIVNFRVVSCPASCRFTLAAFAMLAILSSSSAWAQSGYLVAVEEDWELVLTEPDPEVVAPQITCIMSPNNNLNDTYFSFEINHLTGPTFSPGGLHIHRWSGDWRLGTWSRDDRAVISEANDTIRWTQSLRVGLGRLTFEVQNGTSDTWGNFGFGHFELDQSWGVPHINSYTPDVTLANSGIGYASNRVSSLKITRIKKTYIDGSTVIDNTERVLFAQ